ncbi:MAG: cell division protein FtsQ/DivIB [Burkholderiales bacterium]
MMAGDHTSGRISPLAALRRGTGGARVAGRGGLRPEQSVDVPFRNRRVVVLGAAIVAMIVAAALMWFALGALPEVGNSLPIERVVFVSATNTTLTEVDDEALKRVANALTTSGASMLQLDLVGLASIVKQVQWVRKATIRRQFPSTIVVVIEEHKPVARWVADATDDSQTIETSTLVNSFGDVFTATIADERRDQLPKLAGPEGSSFEVLTRYAALQAPLATIGRSPRSIVMTPRRAWQVKLDNGVVLELGRADVDERMARFIHSYPGLAALQVADAVVDLRYQSGLTIRHVNALAAGGKLTKPAPARKPAA